MANNYVLSSSLLELAPAQLKKAKAIVSRVVRRIETAEDSGCSVNVEWYDDGVGIYHDESACLDHVVKIVTTLLKGLRIDRPFVFSWAYTCDKPRIDEFGGGACVLQRGHKPHWIVAMNLAQEYAENRMKLKGVR